MTPIDEDPQGAGATPQVLTVGNADVGEVLAERYRLEEHFSTDSLGRQLWRGADVILQRPVTVVLRYPGGDSAAEMLSAAVAASRIVHPHLVGVYDAIDEGERAYVVREWVQGTSLRDVVAEYGQLEADKVVAIGHAVADAVAALHDTGMAHGNVQPGTVLIGDDGRVVLADARADDAATVEADLRAIGAVLYCALTSYWPHAEAGASVVADAPRDHLGAVLPPSQLRDGVPSHLDELTVDLLNPQLEPPSAEILSAELGRLDNGEEHRALFGDEEIGLDSFDNTSISPDAPQRDVRKLALIIAAVLVMVLVGGIAAFSALGDEDPGTKSPQAAGTGTAQGKNPTGQVTDLRLTADKVRIVDPGGNGTEVRDMANLVDGNVSTAWKTDAYPSANFGGIAQKVGMGILIDLGAPTSLNGVQVELGNANSTLELRGSNDPAVMERDSDVRITELMKPLSPAKLGIARTILPVSQPAEKVRYVMVWCTKLPPEGGRYRLVVNEIVVKVQAA